MKQPYLVLLALLLLPFLSSAQKNFKPGFTVSLTGDTVSGTFDYREWDNNPRSVKFMPSGNTQAKKITPKDAYYFEINGLEAYQRYEGLITMDRIDDNSLINGRDTTVKLDTVFLKVLQQGDKITLYSYSDRIKTRFYYTERKGETPQELGYRVYYNSDQVDIYTGKGRTVNENTYMKQLYNLANKYDVLTPKLQRVLEDSRYEKRFILEIVSKINGLKSK